MRDMYGSHMPEDYPEASPEITPEMIQSVTELLEMQGLIKYAEGGAYIPTEKGWKFLRETEPVEEVVEAIGDENILATGKRCFSIVKFKNVKVGDQSVIGVDANKGCVGFSKKFKDALKTARKIFITIECGGESDTVTAFGSPALKLTDSNEIFIRKGDLIDGKTLVIFADKAASDLKESLKKRLKIPEKIKITFEVK